jgi:hypothetical protein
MMRSLFVDANPAPDPDCLPVVCLACVIEAGAELPFACHLSPCARHARPEQAPIAAADRTVVDTLSVQIRDEMERLTSEEVLGDVSHQAIKPQQMLTLSAVYLTGLHYLLAGCSSTAALLAWVEQALTMLRYTRAISTRHARRVSRASMVQMEVA